jgi:alkylation response protein AidB-like acyl-CoA dehydrogenase
MDFGIPTEYKQIKALTRKFVAEVLRPVEEEVEATSAVSDELHARLVAESKSYGLWGAFAPERIGGGGLTTLVPQTHVREELGATSYVLRSYVDSGGGLHMNNASEYQREKFFMPAFRGEVRSFAAMTEPNAGTDNGAMETTADRDGDNWVINGTKHFISGVDHAAWGIVYAVTDRERRKHGGISGFIVEKGAPGFTVGRRQIMMGHRGFNQYVLHFDNCVVPHANMIGQEGTGLRQFLTSITGARVKVAIEAVGSAQYAQDLAVSYVKVREVLGSVLAAKQGIQWMLVDSMMELQSARLMCYQAAWKADQGEDFRVEASMAKAYATETAQRVIDRAIQVHGGLGYCEELPLARLFRDIRGARIYEGANEAQRYIISKSLFQ